MRFVNHTPLPGALIPNAEDGDDMTALVLCAATFSIAAAPEGKTPDGPALSIAYEQRPLLSSLSQQEPGDDHFIREGVSVTATGFVHAPGGRATKADASIHVGNEERSVRAFGPRVWREGVFGACTATAPLPFDRVAMTWENAYGGASMRKTSIVKHEGREAVTPEHPVFYPMNAEGTGFYLERAEAVEKPLPQLEHPDQPIRAWDDRPHPVCFAPYPVHGGMRPLVLKSGEKVDLKLAGRLTCPAAPWLIFPAIAPGTPIVLRGMRPRGEVIAFAVPECPVLVQVILGGLSARLKPALDAIDIDAEALTARFVYRTPFRFALFQGEAREAHLLPSEHFPKLPPPRPTPRS